MNFTYITTDDELQSVISVLSDFDILGLDVETRGKDAYSSELLLVQLSASEDIVMVFDARKVNLQPLCEAMSLQSPLMLGHNLKYDVAVLDRVFDYIPDRLYDTMIAYGVLNTGLASPFVSLRELVQTYCNIVIDKDIRKSFETTYGELTQEQLEYAALDVTYLHTIFNAQLIKLQNDNLVEIAKLEFDLIPVVIQLESTGIGFDSEAWITAAKNLQIKAVEQDLQLGKMVGGHIQDSFFGTPTTTFNPRSPKQVLEHLKKLGFSTESTGEKVLKEINHPFVKLLLKYRKTSKLANTYGLNFIEHIKEDGRIHAEFNQLGTVSGRFSSAKPNLQNIPHTTQYRNCFTAAPNHMLITADFSQIELRVGAVLSGEQLMIDEYSKPKSDLHRLTASKVYDTDFADVTDEQRFDGKTTNFSTVYGISKFSLASTLECAVKKAEMLINGFRTTYKALTAYMESQSNFGLSKGYTVTKIGRRRYYQPPDFRDPQHFKKVASIRRMAANSVIQGTAADILKVSMLKMYKALKPYNAKLVNIVHDEVVVECPTQFVSQVIGIITNSMSDAASEMLGDSVRWDVSLKVGETWMKA